MATARSAPTLLDREDVRRTRGESAAPRAGQLPTPVAVAPVAVGGLIGPGADRTLQRTVDVGAVDDPLELEADETARRVVARLRRRAADPPSAPGGRAEHGASIHRRDYDRDPGTGDLQPVGFAGGALEPSVEARLRGASGGGRTLSNALRAPLERAIGADFSGVRVHTGSDASTLNRAMSALAFTHGRDIYFRDGMPDTGSDSGLHLLAHELTHTVQQGNSPVHRHAVTSPLDAGRAHDHDLAHDHDPAHDHDLGELEPGTDVEFAGAVGVRRFTGTPTVLRHAAYEHYLLGQLQPAEIAMIPQVRKIKANKEQNKRVKKSKKAAKTKDDKDVGLEEGVSDLAAKTEVMHILDREMLRLLEYKDDPEAQAHRIGEKGQVSKKDGKWNVPIVVLTCRDGAEVVVTYSEMNTMPDLFGNPEAIASTPKKHVLALLQGVRQQAYIELTKIRQELFTFADNALYSKVNDGDFAGAQGPRSQEVNAKAYEIRTEKQVNKATTRKKNSKKGYGQDEQHEQYFAALERNACHFAPESWHQWEGYHREAVRLAKIAALNQLMAQTPGLDPATVKMFEDNGADHSNQALIQNSFGEHYLQDSFAAGHLIDKTKIMQWFTLWLEKTGQGLGSGQVASAQWKMAVYAAAQDLKSNPQALHDKMVRGQIPTPTAATDEIGMTSSPEIELMMKWRALAKGKSSKKSLAPKDAAAEFGPGDYETDMRLLVKKGFASKDLIGKKYTLKSSQLETVAPKRGLSKPQAVDAYEATRGKSPGKLSAGETRAAAAEFNVAAYNMLLSNAYIGSSTKFFHDKFCKEGLEVHSGLDDLGRIYGDANMLNAGGQKGVAYAAETSRMSRASVFSILDGGPEEFSTKSISDRFPRTVKFNGVDLEIDKFNESLRAEGERKLFKEAKTFGALVVYKAMNGISDKGALDVNKLVKGIELQIGDLDDSEEF